MSRGRTIAAAPLLLALGLAAVLLLPGLDVIPGLHGDEAWSGVRAYEILHGARPAMGMNPYAGPMYHYLLAPVLAVFGFKVWALRLLTAITALVTVVLYYVVVSRIFGRPMAGFAVLALVSMPFFAGFGRLAGENFALNPLLALACLVFLLQGSPASAALAGLSAAIGTWNHAIFASVPIAVAVTAFARHGTALFRRTTTYLAALGYVLGLAPALVVLWRWWDTDPVGINAPQASSFLEKLLGRIADWPGLFLQLAHGDLIFRRFAGTVVLPTPNLIAPIALAGGLALWTFTRRGGEQRERVVDLARFGVALFVATLVIVPGNVERYFLLPLYLVPVLVAAAFTWMRRTRARALVVILFSLLVVVQLARIRVNYFTAQERDGARSSIFYLGRQPETSNHFMRTDALYAQLVSQGARHVVGEFFIVRPLEFYDLDVRHFASVSEEDAKTSSRSGAYAPDTFAVFYAEGYRRNDPGRYPSFVRFSSDGRFVTMRLTE